MTTKDSVAEEPESAGSAGKNACEELQGALGYKFKNLSWLERALTHRSASHAGVSSDYERLEFLGDAVFDLCVAHLLSDRHPKAREGELSKMRAALVNTQSLARLARKMNLGRYIRLGRGEIATEGFNRPSILADVLEAVMGAVYRDSDYEEALRCVEKLFGEEIDTVNPRDPKTELQEVLHTLGAGPPTYLLEYMEGPEHAPTFVSVVEIDGQTVGRGSGATKKQSQQNAAEEALRKIAAGEADFAVDAGNSSASVSDGDS